VAARVVLQLIVVALALMPAVAVAASDELSAARPDEARVTHVALDLVADFSSRTLAGAATLSLAVAPGARSLVLDTRDLEIESVADASGRMLAFRLDEGNAVIGRPLHVTLEPGSTSLTIRYRTSPGAAALQWLAPEQTAGRRHPYLFSQGQAILTRTWIPTQDSPGIRQTYTARIVVPRELRAVMSAEHLTPEGVEVTNGRAFEFRMEQPIPPYLIALAVGDIAFRSLGARTGVFAEPSVLDRAAYEFGEVEQMLESAERLYGPYRWDRYDILVLPPSFPYGGMENPRLTFATPTILAGDRSLTSLIAHELAHSWSGNLVTNATWRDFWLNEGFTTYFENRIMEALHGRERAEMLEYLGRRELLESIARHKDDPRATTLYTTEGPLDPDAALSTADYEKGAAFLRMLEVNLGRDRFDRWLRSYFDRFAFQPMTTPRFHEELRRDLLDDDECTRRAKAAHRGRVALRARPALERAGARVGGVRQGRGGGAAASRPAAPGVRAARPAAGATQEWQHFLQNAAADADGGAARRISTASSASARGATARCSSRGCGSRSATGTSPRCRRSNGF
jgi:leukotriene-A4 hydrolase